MYWKQGTIKHNGSRWHCTLESHLILVHLYFVSDQFQNKRVLFFLLFPTYVQFYTHSVVIYFLEPIQKPKFSDFPEKSTQIFIRSQTANVLVIINWSSTTIYNIIKNWQMKEQISIDNQKVKLQYNWSMY